MAISSDKNIVRNLRIRYMVLVDWALIWLALVLAVEMRLENPGQSLDYLRHAWPLLILTPLVRLPLYFRLNLYNRLWRYAGIEDLRSMVKAGLLAPLIIGSLN